MKLIRLYLAWLFTLFSTVNPAPALIVGCVKGGVHGTSAFMHGGAAVGNSALQFAPVRAIASGQEMSVARRRYQRGQLIWKNGEAWGRWREDVIDPATGQIHRKHVKQYLGEFGTKKLALRGLQERLADINSPSYRPRMEQSFEAFAERWLKEVAVLRKRSGELNVRCHIRKHIIPALKRHSLREITPFEVQSLVTSLTTEPAHIHAVVKTVRALNRAAHAWRLTTIDWMEGVKLPAIEQRESRFFTAAEAIAIITAAQEPYRTFYWIAAETGIRLGEACALRVSDFNLPLHAVVIRWSYTCGELGSTKSRKVRSFAISTQLAEHLTRFTANKQPSEFLFTKSGDRPWCGSSVVKDNLHPLLKELGIPMAGMHAFRHCNATILEEENVPLKVRQERLGHMNGEQLTIGVYTHAKNKDHRRAAEKIGRVLCANVPNQKQQFKQARTNGRVM